MIRKLQIAFLWGVCLGTGCWVQAQEPMRIVRCEAVDGATPIYNIHVDENSNQWVGNADGVYRLFDLNLAEEMVLRPGEENLLTIPDGNADIRWMRSELDQLMGGILGKGAVIITGHYDEQREQLLLGTNGYGLFIFDLEPGLLLKEHLTRKSSKLRSDYINTIYINRAGKRFIGTEEGLLIIDGNKQELVERDFSIDKIADRKGEIWLLGDDLVGNLEGGDTWFLMELPSGVYEGNIYDMAFDTAGMLWVASEIIAQYNPENRNYETYGPAQYYTSQYANCLTVTPRGTVWVGTQDKGLYLIEPASTMTVSLLVDQPVSCAGNGGDGVLAVRITGGEPPYQYNWSEPNARGNRVENVSPGSYTVSVTDQSGQKRSAQVELPDPRMELQVQVNEPVKEDGAPTGVATVQVQGGTPSYRYKWDNGETSAMAIELTEGQHTVTVTDENGCTAKAAVEMPRLLGELQARLEPLRTLNCADGNDAALVVNVNGGKSPYTFTWNNPNLSGETVENIGPGQYAVSVTDAAGNSVQAQFTLEAPQPINAGVRLDATASKGAADGQATVTARGGAGDFTYRWDTGETTATATQLNAGSHTVTITDANGCTFVTSVEMSEEILPLELSMVETEGIKCYGDSSGRLELTVQGGKSPYDYQWSTPKGQETIAQKLSVGTYTVTVTDAEGTEKKITVNLGQPAELTLTAIAESPASTGQSDGKASARASGGSGQYQYAWDNGTSGEVAENLAPGIHTVTVTDFAGCTATSEVTISEDILPLALALESPSGIDCQGGATGVVTVRATGGKAPYTFRWNNDAEGERLEQLAAGTYGVTVTDAIGQEASGEIVLVDAPPLVATVETIAPASTGGNDGQAEVTTTGGASPYTYSWDNGGTEAIAENLSPGDHTVTVTDANGCTASGEVTITEDILPLTLSLQQTDSIACNGGSGAALQVDVRGGKGPFTYAWEGVTADGARATNLSAGSYALTVSDAIGQEASGTIEIGQPQLLKATVQAIAPASTGGNDGQAEVTTTGGASPYTYSWDNGGTEAIAENLSPGDHTVTVTDANGCTASGEVTITEDILPLTLSLQQTDSIACNGGSGAALQVDVRGGKGPFTYAWEGVTADGAQATNLSAGSYALTVSDASGQEASGTIEIGQPQLLKATVQAIAPASTGGNDGQAEVTTTGGASPYTYSWDNGGTEAIAENLSPGDHTVTVTDANGCTASGEVTITEDILPLTLSLQQTDSIACNGGSGAALQVDVRGGKGPFIYAWEGVTADGVQATNLSAGSYALTVSDAIGQEASGTIEIGQPQLLKATVQAIAPASTGGNDGQAEVTTTGGASPYTYSWDNGGTEAIAENLSPGDHTVTVTDANGCTTTGTATITEDILPLAVKVEAIQEINCHGEQTAALQAVVEGGKGPFTYQWSPAEATEEALAGLAAGSYNLTVSDASGQTAEAEITIDQPEALVLNLSADAPASANGEDGQASVQVRGGETPYVFAWSNGANSAEVSNLPAGTHQLTVTDANGCSATGQVEITEDILPLVVSIEQKKPIDCNGAANAVLQVQVQGGKGPFTYAWSPSSLEGENPQRVDVGEYAVSVTDVQGTTKNARITIDQPEELVIATKAEGVATDDTSADGKARVQIRGGTEPYEILWDNQATRERVNNLTYGAHQVTVTDANGCEKTAEVNIDKRALPELAGQVERGQRIQMEAIQFDADSINIKNSFEPVLDEIYTFLEENPEVIVEIGGHTNNLPPDDYCDRLSTARAKAVAEYVIQQGVPSYRVRYRGYGKRDPIASNDTPEGRQKNQRVEIKIVSTGGG